LGGGGEQSWGSCPQVPRGYVPESALAQTPASSIGLTLFFYSASV